MADKGNSRKSMGAGVIKAAAKQKARNSAAEVVQNRALGATAKGKAQAAKKVVKAVRKAKGK